MTDYLLAGHKCKKIASMKMGADRDWWLGKLLEPINGYPTETHCLHIRTPEKEVVLGVNQGDMEQLAVLCQIVCGPINPTWLNTMEGHLKSRANNEHVRFIPKKLDDDSWGIKMEPK
jgi:hypothetical protein